MATRQPPTEQVYELDIRLTDIEPPIWRRLTVSDQITLAALHHVLQVGGTFISASVRLW